MRRALLHPLLLCLLFAAPGASAAQERDIRAELSARLAQLGSGATLTIAGERLSRSAELSALYIESGGRPLWSDATGAALLAQVQASIRDGLTPAHYHERALSGAAARPRTPAGAAELDLLRTDALVQLARDLRDGRGRPAAEARVAAEPATSDALTPLLARAIENGRIAELLASLRPQHEIYSGLTEALARLRGMEAGGGWPSLPAGPAMRPGSIDARVPLLRARLRLSGDLPLDAGTGGSSAFDAALEDGVRRFQHRHGLNEDGIVGPRTLAALNVAVGARIAAVRVNLERARWIVRALPARFVVVNIAGARVYLIDGRDVRLESRVIVGKTATRTPIFRATMQRVELNPYWSVPPSINGEILAAIRRDGSYLRREGIRVFTQAGREIPRGSIDYSRYSGATFPYVFRQDPGPLNALGRIKLLFPNAYNVYLHDTPARSLFAQEERLFSHGCIRVQHPVRLAAEVLADPGWTEASLEAEIERGAHRTIPLRSALPVLVLYWTASVDLHGELHFYPDVYDRDAAILAELDRP